MFREYQEVDKLLLLIGRCLCDRCMLRSLFVLYLFVCEVGSISEVYEVSFEMECSFVIKILKMNTSLIWASILYLKIMSNLKNSSEGTFHEDHSMCKSAPANFNIS